MLISFSSPASKNTFVKPLSSFTGRAMVFVGDGETYNCATAAPATEPVFLTLNVVAEGVADSDE